MARASLPDLSPDQVIALLDEVLANADSLLTSAMALLDAGQVGRARAMAILGMEESGKAIALHERRVAMQYAEPGEPFMCKSLQELWPNHRKKLETVHRFLTWEEYWFGVEPSNPEENAAMLGTIEAWKEEHNTVKQRGFYVDLGVDGQPITPASVADEEQLGEVIAFVHQIGWQIRLGEHIEGKAQDERERDIEPRTPEQAAWLDDVEALSQETRDAIRASALEGTPGTPLPNPAYRFNQPDADPNPFKNFGRPGYEAETREILRLKEDLDTRDTATTDDRD